MPKSIMSKAPETRPEVLISGLPGGIAAQERRGQHLFAEVDQLPKQMRGVTRQQLEALGFAFGDDIDELFVQATLPPGWKKRPTDHAMHTDLLDEKGRKRGGIFYKAAYYDQRADMGFNRRYVVSGIPREEGADGPRQYEIVVLKDGATLRSFGSRSYKDFKACDELEAEATAWLKENYPDHDNPFAYWD